MIKEAYLIFQLSCCTLRYGRDISTVVVLLQFLLAAQETVFKGAYRHLLRGDAAQSQQKPIKRW